MQKARGFTLIEMMVVVAIIGILAALAWPNYQRHLAKGRRAQAQSFMMEVSNKENQYLLDARQYALGVGAFATLNVAPPADLANFYTFNVAQGATATPPSYLITATAINAQAKDGTLTLDDTGAKQRIVPGGGAWQETAGTYNW